MKSKCACKQRCSCVWNLNVGWSCFGLQGMITLHLYFTQLHPMLADTLRFQTHSSSTHRCIYACIHSIFSIDIPCQLPVPPMLLLRYRCPIPGLAGPPQIWARGLIWSRESWGLSAAPWSAPLLLMCSLAWTCRSSHSPAGKIWNIKGGSLKIRTIEWKSHFSP